MQTPRQHVLVLWCMGRTLVWSATWVETLAPSHLPSTIKRAGAAAEPADRSKSQKYWSLSPFEIQNLKKKLKILRWPRAGGRYLAQYIRRTYLSYKGGPVLVSWVVCPGYMLYICNNNTLFSIPMAPIYI